MPPNREHWWSTKQPQVTDLRWVLTPALTVGLPVTSERHWPSFQVTRLFHKATVSHCDLFLLLHMYLLFETSPGWLQCWRGFFLTSIWWGSTQLQCIYYLRRILISRPPRVFRRFKRRSCSFRYVLHDLISLLAGTRLYINTPYAWVYLIDSFSEYLIVFNIVKEHLNHKCVLSGRHWWWFGTSNLILVY